MEKWIARRLTEREVERREKDRQNEEEEVKVKERQSQEGEVKKRETCCQDYTWSSFLV